MEASTAPRRTAMHCEIGSRRSNLSAPENLDCMVRYIESQYLVAAIHMIGPVAAPVHDPSIFGYHRVTASCEVIVMGFIELDRGRFQKRVVALQGRIKPDGSRLATGRKEHYLT